MCLACGTALKSDGPYGIWGHGFGDLWLERATRKDDGTWDLFIGS
jgi:hypothetical protein